MKAFYPAKVEKAVESLLNKSGSSTPELRQDIERYAAALLRGDGNAPEIPADLVRYVDKVVLHAYKVTDADVQQLKDAGYSEDAIYEITLCASVGASLAQFERGLQAVGARG